MHSDRPAAVALPRSLYLKSCLVGTAADRALHKLRWVLGSWQRYRHPELWEIYLEGQRLHGILSRLLKPDSVCVDVGCHIGSFLKMAYDFAPIGRHIAFEPSPTKARWLRQHFPKADIFASAVGDEMGTITFHENYVAPGLSFVSSDQSALNDHTAREVALCKLDDVLSDREKIDLIKIDVEGNELSVLRGAQRVIEDHRPTIIFEFGPGSDDLRRILFEWLTSAGYGIHTYADFLYGRGALGFDEFRRCGVYPFRALNFLAAPNN
jgi:FkbM family methyltransferase